MKLFTIIFMTLMCLMLIMCSKTNMTEPDTYYVYTNGNVVMIPYNHVIVTSNWYMEHYPVPANMEFIMGQEYGEWFGRMGWKDASLDVTNDFINIGIDEPATNIGKTKQFKLFFMLTE